MAYSEEIKKIRKQCFLSQDAFSKELEVSFSTINRWEGGKTKPNLQAMKKIKEFCESHKIDFLALQNEWNNEGEN